MVRRVGHIRAFATLAAMAIVSILAHAVFISPVAWMFLRATVGASMIGLYITVESWLNERADRYNRGRILASYEMVAMGSMALGQFLIAVGQLESTLPFLIAAAMFAIGVVPVALTQLPEPEPGATQRFDMRQLFAVSPLAVVGTLTCGLRRRRFLQPGTGLCTAARARADRHRVLHERGARRQRAPPVARRRLVGQDRSPDRHLRRVAHCRRRRRSAPQLRAHRPDRAPPLRHSCTAAR
jgi:MFS family permease